MNKNATIDQIQYLFTFPFEDLDWKRKFLIGFLLYIAGFIVPVIPWLFVSGYISRVIKSSIDGQYSLPEWEDWGDLLVQGLKIFGVMIIAMLPMIIFFGCGYIGMMMPAFMGGLAGDTYIGEISPVFFILPLFSSFGGMCLMGLGMFFSLLLMILVPPAIGHMIAKDEFSAAFRVAEWLSVFKANIGGYLIAYVLTMGTSFMLTLALQLLYMTFILCFLFPVVVSLISIYLSVVMGAIFGQAYQVGLDNSTFFLPEDQTSSEEDQPVESGEGQTIPAETAAAENEPI